MLEHIKLFISIYFYNIKLLLNQFSGFSLSESKSGQIGFQDPATPIAERIIEIHNYVFGFLVIVLIFVSYMLYRILVTFSFNVIDKIDKTTIKKEDWKLIYYLSSLKFTHNTTIEIIWTIVPALILVAIAIPSFGLLYAMDDIIDPDITVKITGHQWYWDYEYSDFGPTVKYDSQLIHENDLEKGQPRLLEVDNSMVIPVNTYIRLNITAADVLHSWTVPSFGVKIDAVPQRINSGILYVQRLGTFYGQCSEICGVNHSVMPIKVDVVTADNYINWLQNKIDTADTQVLYSVDNNAPSRTE